MLSKICVKSYGNGRNREISIFYEKSLSLNLSDYRRALIYLYGDLFPGLIYKQIDVKEKFEFFPLPPRYGSYKIMVFVTDGK